MKIQKLGWALLAALLLVTALSVTCSLFGMDTEDNNDDDQGDDDQDDDDIDDDDDDADTEQALIPAGVFTMGCEPTDNSCEEDEQPAHDVYVSAYYIDLYEVTNQQYADYLNAYNPENQCNEEQYELCVVPADYFGWETERGIRHEVDGWIVDPGWEERPAIGVNWDGADWYCRAYDMRLPTEAEWEKAAKFTIDDVGNTYQFIYPWGNDWLSNAANWAHNGDPYEGTELYPDTTPVGFFNGSLVDGYQTLDGRSPHGLYDMAGNAAEWVSDWWDPDYYSEPPEEGWVDPQGPSSGWRDWSNPHLPLGPYKVLRGGAYQYSDKSKFRATYRYWDFTNAMNSTAGFRCVTDL
ncbi:MAG: SUMF1/EgtB/PvdO family nonheme iron enzyme [Candidatus Alcyoniella australis]|nr:SUMF1/EgtB/PvdO family nonheme iron enzyme [Candidatus Alcyoniella australis]